MPLRPALILPLLATLPGLAADDLSEKALSILDRRCFECHSHSAGAKPVRRRAKTIEVGEGLSAAGVSAAGVSAAGVSAGGFFFYRGREAHA
ncbi:MAG: hypothetical protein ACKOQ9_07485, partial [Verrucomicrobiota bacterium]